MRQKKPSIFVSSPRKSSNYNGNKWWRNNTKQSYYNRVGYHHHEPYLLSFNRTLMPAASVGETWGSVWGLSAGLCRLKLLEEVLLGVPGREDVGELTTDGGYHEFVGIPCECGWASCSWEPLYMNTISLRSYYYVYNSKSRQIYYASIHRWNANKENQ